ncbi:hypothetical protein WFS18_01115 [Ureaplasma parvum]|uniref:Uncharacterized protein UU139 n=2 Tax=Ureaplasma parvum serovar 3 TaxID=38504 RepID=Y139_UREPA|nr:hypothetical protein [Ureaplasma parvum]Q9PR05.1 RecName: Full=Uncharacterized protein UU139 [Ureaplasma parvum serovar 3 str. ATCC 700970]pir/B82930/ hypothetical protein UU139 [imported] - Ureaplasma urealyticum [Ureaplasma urealyticum]AAF30545.1 unique hypothetical [Ureaplasma parvum serovar 3 str. ATCC 700970]ACA32713.1 conserved hypothetical protein [Ureaplasma parvum serovar 3 str. ATCC 27815]ASD24510.1 hypothetical protein CEG38_01115 [Ureaplasma parvum]ASD25210.1 hypothetical prote
MDEQIFIQLLENNLTNSKSYVTQPIILEFKTDVFLIINQILKQYKKGKIIKNNTNEIILEIDNKLISITNLDINKFHSYQIVNINENKNIYNERNSLILFDLVNYIIEKNQNSIRHINFWTIQMSVVNWIYFITYNFNNSYLIDPNWKKYVFKIKKDESKGVISTNLLHNYGFVDFVVQSKSQNFLKAYRVQDEILKSVLNLGDNLNNEFLEEIMRKYDTYKIIDRDHKYLVINIE